MRQNLRCRIAHVTVEGLEGRRLLSVAVAGTFLAHEKSGIQPNTVNDLILHQVPVDTNYVETYEGGPIANLTDGKTAENPSNLNEPSQLPDFGNAVFDLGHGPWYATYQLDTRSHPGGYDLTEIDSITGHQDTRTDQTIDIQVQFVGADAGFYSLSAGKNFSYRPGLGDGAAKLALTDTTGILARGVSAVKFVAVDENSVFRELVVTGTPSAAAISPPAAPTGLLAQTGDGQTITVGFTSQSDSASEFLLDRMPPPQYFNRDFVPVALFGPTAAGQTVTFTDSAVPMGGPVVYRVRAFNNYNGGADSTPATVQSIAGWLIQGSITLTTWFPDGDSPITDRGVLDALVFLDSNKNGKLDPGERSIQSAGGAFTFAGQGAQTLRVVQLPGRDPSGNPYEYLNPISGYLDISVSDGQASIAAFNDTQKGQEPPGVHVMPAPQGPITGQPAPPPPGGTGSGAPGSTAASPTLSVTIPHSVVLQTLQGGGGGPARISVVNSGTSRVNEMVNVTIYATAIDSGNSNQMVVASGHRWLRLRSGGAAPMNLRVKVPAGLLPGDYGLLAVVRPATGDTTTALATQSVGHLTVKAATADLAVSFASSDSPVLALGRPASALLDITNDGTVPARGAMTLSLFASTDATLDSSDTLLAVLSNARISLHPSRSRRVRLHFVPPASLAPGSYHLIASLQPEIQPPDNNPQNDVAASPLGTVYRRRGGLHSIISTLRTRRGRSDALRRLG